MIFTTQFLNTTKYLWPNLFYSPRIISYSPELSLLRPYAKHSDNGCRRATADIPPEGDPICPEPCDKKKKKKGILHKIKFKIIEGGTNFGS